MKRRNYAAEPARMRREAAKAAALRASREATRESVCQAPGCATALAHTRGIGRVQRYCSRTCIARAWAARKAASLAAGKLAAKQAKAASLTRVCPQCGATFSTTVKAVNRRCGKYCGRDCHMAAIRKPEGSAVSRRADRARRANKERLGVGPVDKRKIFERDGWTCYLCMTPTLRPPYEWRHAKAPSVDHAIALAKGGTHTMDNLLTAHRGCNTLKGTRPWFECMEALQ